MQLIGLVSCSADGERLCVGTATVCGLDWIGVGCKRSNKFKLCLQLVFTKPFVRDAKVLFHLFCDYSTVLWLVIWWILTLV